MRFTVRLRTQALISRLAAASLLIATAAGSAAATECGELRAEAAQWKAAASVEETLASTIGDATRAKHQAAARESSAQLKNIERRLAAACAPKRTTIAALPLGYVVVPPGNGSRASIDPGERWGLALTTLAGAKSGIVFNDPAIVNVPGGARWESEGKVDELAVVVALDAQLTVEEPTQGVGSWRIDLKAAPVVVPAVTLKACAEGGSGNIGGAKLPATTCAMLLRVAPLASPTAVPERGRATLIGEWQYGDRAGFELGDELAEVASSGPPPRLDLALDLAAPIPGVSEGKKLVVTAGLNRKQNLAGSAVKLAEECGADDTACQEQWFSVEVWFDRTFAVPFVRRRPLEKTAIRFVGSVADRLGKTLSGQRVMAASTERRIYAITDPEGKYRFDGLPAGELTIAAVGKKLGQKPQAEYQKVLPVGVLSGSAPKILIDRLFE